MAVADVVWWVWVKSVREMQKAEKYPVDNRVRTHEQKESAFAGNALTLKLAH